MTTLSRCRLAMFGVPFSRSLELQVFVPSTDANYDSLNRVPARWCRVEKYLGAIHDSVQESRNRFRHYLVPKILAVASTKMDSI